MCLSNLCIPCPCPFLEITQRESRKTVAAVQSWIQDGLLKLVCCTDSQPRLHAGMDWQSWGDGVHKPVLPCGTGAQKQTSVAHAVAMDNKPLPLLPILPPAYRAPQPRHEDDVVIQGRQKWAMARSGGEFLRPELQASFPPFTEHLRPQVLQASQALSSPRFGHGPKRFPEPCNPERARALNETEIDPVSGLEMLGTQPTSLSSKSMRCCECERS